MPACRSTLVLASVLAAVGVAAAPSPAARDAQIISNPSDKALLKFVKPTLTAKAGTITLVMANPSMLPHNIAVKGKGLDKKGPVVGKGGTSKVTVTLKPGVYTFYCSVAGHEAAGMKGILTVK